METNIDEMISEIEHEQNRITTAQDKMDKTDTESHTIMNQAWVDLQLQWENLQHIKRLAP